MLPIDRRDFLKLAGLGAAVLVSGPGTLVRAANGGMGEGDFLFVQFSDSHWGFNNPRVNPDFAGTLKKGIAAVNSMKSQPEFVIFTGDLTHNTEDPKERRKRMAEFRDIIKKLKVNNVKLMPGEHDARFDNGEAFREFFGETHYSFVHKGINFIALDNASDPTSSIGEKQLKWLSGELKKIDPVSRIIIYTHRPLFDLYREWDWWTRDGAKTIDLLMPYRNVAVLYGHVHQKYHYMTGHIPHYSAKSMMYPFPAPGSVPRKRPLDWDSSKPYRGLGYRSGEDGARKAEFILTEYPIEE